MQLLFGRNGSVNLLLDDWFGFKIPFMEGLNGVIFVQSLHYFPFILINLSAALRNIDRAMEEAAQNLGSSGFRLFRRIVFPLAMPGYLAGASLVFVKVFDDLATPLLLNVKDMLAPQAYLRVTSIGIADPMGYVISVVLIVASVAAIWLSALATRGRDYATTQRGGGGLARRNLSRGESCRCRSRRSGPSRPRPTTTRWRITHASSARVRSTSRIRCSTQAWRARSTSRSARRSPISCCART
jgi:iron(III) transport system permease protein